MPEIITWEATKEPDEVLDYTHSWAKRLLVNGADVGDALRLPDDADVNKRPVVEVVSGTAVLAAVLFDAPEMQLWFEEGVKGKTKIKALVWTVQGRRYEQNFILNVKDT